VPEDATLESCANVADAKDARGCCAAALSALGATSTNRRRRSKRLPWPPTLVARESNEPLVTFS
jgi:hypothetical protein